MLGSTAPCGESLCEAIGVIALVNDTIGRDTESICSSNCRYAVNVDRRAGVNIEDLALAIVGVQARLTVVLYFRM